MRKLFAASLFFVSTFALAAGPAPQAFFSTMLGKLSGTGIASSTFPGANPTTREVKVEQSTRETRPGTWEVTLTVTANSRSTQTITAYEMHDGTFDVVSKTYAATAEILKNTDQVLEFRTSHSDPTTHRMVEVRRVLTWETDGSLNFENEIIQDGVQVQQSHYKLRR